MSDFNMEFGNQNNGRFLWDINEWENTSSKKKVYLKKYIALKPAKKH